MTAVESGGAAESDRELQGYQEDKFALAVQLRALLAIIRDRRDELRERRCIELLARLADDRFTLAVVGQFKRGKSSLMNALVGRALLPVAMLPLTSAITVLKFGAPERLLIHHPGWAFPQEVPVDRLADYVTEKGNPGNAKQVARAVLEVEEPFLRRGLEFVDTPGVGSAIEENTATTLEFLPLCDAAIFVTSADAPLTNGELDFLETVRAHAGKIFFVVNKMDLCGSAAERDEILGFVRGKIAERLGVVPRLFAVSTRDNPHGDGLAELKGALAAFLTGEKSAVLLANVRDHASSLVEEISREFDFRGRVATFSPEDRERRLRFAVEQWRNQEPTRRQFFEELETALTQAALGRTAESLRTMLENEGARFVRHVEALSKKFPNARFQKIVARASTAAARRMSACTDRVLSDAVRRMNLDDDAAAQAAWDKVQSALAAVQDAACDAFETDRIPFTPAPLHVELPRQWADAPANVAITAMRGLCGLLPARWGRRALGEKIRGESRRLVEAFRERGAAAVAEIADEAAERLQRQTENQVRAIQAQLGAEMQGDASAQDFAARLHDIGRRLDGLRSRQSGMPSEETQVFPTLPPPPRPIPEGDASPARWLATRGCPVCDFLDHAAFRFLSQWQYTLATDEDAQRTFAEELGFCPFHTWQLHGVSSDSGESAGYARLARRLAHELAERAPDGELPSLVREMTRPGRPCRACANEARAAADFIVRLAAELKTEKGRQRYAGGQGVCLRHLEPLAAACGPELVRFLLDEMGRRLALNAEDMQSYAIKGDAARRGFASGNEKDAARRTIIHLAGAKTAIIPWRGDGEI